eukprot:11209659-Lingulodinium_polyedra.AAC.1
MEQTGPCHNATDNATLASETWLQEDVAGAAHRVVADLPGLREHICGPLGGGFGWALTGLACPTASAA